MSEDCATVHPWGGTVHSTIREATDADRALPGVADYQYVVVCVELPEQFLTVFGLVQGGATREDAVFWAERMADKNGLHFIRPEGWEDVVGALHGR